MDWKRHHKTGLAVALGLVGTLYLQGAFSPHAGLAFRSLPEVGSPGYPQALASVTNAMTVPGRVVNAWNAPEGYYAARLAAVRSARRTIRFETFYMTAGRRADAFASALVERARAGVKVQFAADAAGCMLPAAYWQNLRDAGVDVRFFHPFDWRSPQRFNARTHRKLLLVDDQVAFTGGAGVSDHWDGDPGHGERAPWCDWEFQLAGPVMASLEGVFMQHWAAMGGVVELAEAAPEAADAASANAPVVITAGEPVDDESAVRLLYQALISSARHRLWIASPYFLPDASARAALVEARRRNVDVRILTEGPLNDKPYAYAAMREQYGELLDAGVTIAEHQPSFMHAKALLVDDQLVCLGSANFDPRSFFHNDELALTSADPALATRVRSFFEAGFDQSLPVRPDAWKQRPAKEHVMGAIAWLFKYQL